MKSLFAFVLASLLVGCGGGSNLNTVSQPLTQVSPIPPKQFTVTCLGDSETYGWTPTGASNAFSWCNKLSVLQPARFVRVKNLAQPSKDITEIFNEQLPEALSAPTDYVIIMSGVNDAYHKVDLAVFNQVYRTMIDLLSRKGSTVVVLTPLPTNDVTRDGDLAKYTQTVMQLPNVQLIDIGSHATPEWWGEYYTKDIHPTDSGYTEITKILLKEIK